MHRTLNGVVRGLVEDCPDCWERMLPFAGCILRTSPMAVLGGKSPYEVVTGLVPKMPIAALATQPVKSLDVGEYVKKLREYMVSTYKTVMQVQSETLEADEGKQVGHLSQELWPGDTVLVKRETSAKREGPARFQSRTYNGLYRIVRKVGRHTFEVEDVADKTAEITFMQPVNADRLIKLDMPELGIDEKPAAKIGNSEVAW